MQEKPGRGHPKFQDFTAELAERPEDVTIRDSLY